MKGKEVCEVATGPEGREAEQVPGLENRNQEAGARRFVKCSETTLPVENQFGHVELIDHMLSSLASTLLWADRVAELAERLEEENKRLAETSSQRSAEISKLISERTDIAGKLSKIMESRGNLETKCDSLMNILRLKEDEIAGLKRNLAQLENEKGLISAEKEMLAENCNGLKQINSVLEESNADLSDRVNAADELVKSLETEKSALFLKLSSAENLLDRAEVDRSNAVVMSYKVSLDLSSLKVEFSQSQGRVVELETRIKVLEKTLEKSKDLSDQELLKLATEIYNIFSSLHAADSSVNFSRIDLAQAMELYFEKRHGGLPSMNSKAVEGINVLSPCALVPEGKGDCAASSGDVVFIDEGVSDDSSLALSADEEAEGKRDRAASSGDVVIIDEGVSDDSSLALSADEEAGAGVQEAISPGDEPADEPTLAISLVRGTESEQEN